MSVQRNLNRLAYFAAVVDKGSFTAAADDLGITKAVVSQQVAKLEAEIGTALLIRTTRRVRPTEAGEAFHKRCLAILRDADSAFDEVSLAGARPIGMLRVAAPLDFGISVVTPAATLFRRTHPQCDVTLRLDDRIVDLLAEKIDLAIRVGWLTDSSFKSRRIGRFRQLAVAIPELARGLKRAAGPEALQTLPFVANSVLSDPHRWRFTRGRETRQIATAASISVNATLAVQHATLAGAGFSVLPDFLVAADLAAGRLVNLLPDWTLPSGGIFLVFPSTRYRPPKASAFAEILSQQIRKS